LAWLGTLIVVWSCNVTQGDYKLSYLPTTANSLTLIDVLKQGPEWPDKKVAYWNNEFPETNRAVLHQQACSIPGTMPDICIG